MLNGNGGWQNAGARYDALFDGLKTAYSEFKAIDTKYSADQDKCSKPKTNWKPQRTS